MVSVVKAGRSTGVTAGNVDFIRLDVKVPGSRTTTSEYAVTSSMHYTLSTHADSGSPLIGADGELVGIILGGSEGIESPKGRKRRLSFDTLRDPVKSRIETAVGGDIQLHRT